MCGIAFSSLRSEAFFPRRPVQSFATIKATPSPLRLLRGVSSGLFGWVGLSVLLACFIKAEVAGAREADGECKAVERLAYAPPNLYLEDIVMNFELDDEDTTVTSLLTLYRRSGTEHMDLVLDGDASVILKSIALSTRATPASPSLRSQAHMHFTELEAHVAENTQFQYRITLAN